MTRNILYFAWVRERIGINGEHVDVPPDVTTPLALAQWLARRGAGYAEAFADPKELRCALDQQIVPMEAELGNAAELAYFPPVTGG